MMSWKSRGSQEVGVKHVTVTRMCIFLMLKVKGHSRENVGTAERYADLRQKNARSVKGTCMVVTLMATVGAIQTMVAPTRPAISVA